MRHQLGTIFRFLINCNSTLLFRNKQFSQTISLNLSPLRSFLSILLCGHFPSIQQCVHFLILTLITIRLKKSRWWTSTGVLMVSEGVHQHNKSLISYRWFNLLIKKANDIVCHISLEIHLKSRRCWGSFETQFKATSNCIAISTSVLQPCDYNINNMHFFFWENVFWLPPLQMMRCMCGTLVIRIH